MYQNYTNWRTVLGYELLFQSKMLRWWPKKSPKYPCVSTKHSCFLSLASNSIRAMISIICSIIWQGILNHYRKSPFFNVWHLCKCSNNESILLCPSLIINHECGNVVSEAYSFNEMAHLCMNSLYKHNIIFTIIFDITNDLACLSNCVYFGFIQIICPA